MMHHVSTTLHVCTANWSHQRPLRRDAQSPNKVASVQRISSYRCCERDAGQTELFLCREAGVIKLHKGVLQSVVNEIQRP